MKRYLKHLLILAAVIVVCTILNPTKAQAASFPSVDKSIYYGRQQLAKMPNSTALLYAYDQIAAGVANNAQKISVYNGINPISQNELQVVFDLYQRDYAHHFWLGKEYSFNYNRMTCVDIVPSYTMSGAQLQTAKGKFDRAADKILAGITPRMSEYERELYLHDALADMITYKIGANAFDAYGALVEGKAVCEGYAEALQYLLQRAGIQSFLAIGYGVNPQTGVIEGHEWNYVRINGKYYHVDLTWDDQNSRLFHSYFNQTDAVMQEDHLVTSTVYALPTCNSTAAHYFTGKDTYLKSYTAAAVGKLLKNNQMTIHVYIPGNVNTFRNWYVANIQNIARNANVTGEFTYSHICLGREAVLSIKYSCNHVNTQTITKATLTGNGSIVKKCTMCGKVTSTTTIKYAKTFTLSATSYTYNGKAKAPTVTVKDSAGKTLVKNTDYTVTYASGRVNAGSYTVTVKGMGKYAFTKTLTFKINPIKASNCSMKLSATSYTYNGSLKAPTVTVKSPTGSTLTKGTSYTVTYASGRRNVGTYTVKVTMKGNYTGTKTLTFKINPASLGTCKLSATSYIYNGSVKTPSVTVKTASGTTLTKNTSYTVTYASGRKNVGTYTVKVTMKGNYTGTRTLTFKIVPKAPSINKLTAKTKALTVTLNKQTTQTSGYEIQYATNKSFTSAKTTTVTNSTSTKTLSGLKAKTTYYVRVRAYKTVSGVKIYSNWSAAKYLKTK